MQDLIKKLSELVGMAEVKIKKTEALSADLAKRKVDADKRDSDLAFREEVVTALEATLKAKAKKFKAVEDVDQLKTALEDKIKGADAMARELEEAKAKFENEKDAELKTISAKKAKLEAQFAELERNKKAYKDQVLKEVEFAVKSKATK